MTQAEKSKEIERISDKINAYCREKRIELNELIDQQNNLIKETNNQIDLMIVFEADKKGVSKELLKIILKDCKL